MKRLSPKKALEAHTQWLSQCNFAAPILRTYLDRMEEEGILTRYEELLNGFTAKRVSSLTAAQQKMLAELCFQSERDRLAGNVDRSQPGAEEATERLFQASESLAAIAHANLSEPVFVEIIMRASALICAAAQCGNLDSKSELPKRRARDQAEGMRQRRKSKVDPIIAERRKRLRELLDRAPVRVKSEANLYERRRKFRAWLTSEGLARDWARSTLIRDVDAILPLEDGPALPRP